MNYQRNTSTHSRRLVPVVILIALIFASGLAARAADDPRPFSSELASLFKERCVRCHGPAKAEGGLNLSLPAGIVRGGKNGPVVSPHDLENSSLWERVDEGEMPPKRPLSSDEKDLIKKWIIAGAPGLPRPDASEALHWSFQPLKKPALPQVQGKDAMINPIDTFVEAKLERKGLKIESEADRRRLIRRVSLAVTGLPPTPESVNTFLKDNAKDAYARMVERYLSHSGYGERWGKFWLDAAGYADSNGYFNADSDRPLAYRYRDYVIRSLNQDRPFDRFIHEQLAGDELADYSANQTASAETVDRLVATHYLRNGQDGSGESDGNPDEVRVDRYTALESAQQIVATSLLGLTFQCAKCHSHKFEPITQEDYYRFQAILDPVFPAATPELWTKPQARFVYAPLRGEKEEWDRKLKEAQSRHQQLQKNQIQWIQTNRPPGQVLFEDRFDSAPTLSEHWSNVAPGDDAPGGKPPVTVDGVKAPSARIHDKRLEINAGVTLDSWLTTKAAFDWTPDKEGASIQVTFDLVDLKLNPGGKPAERVGYFIATHDFDDSGKTPGGNILIDGHPKSSSSVHVDYPGKDDLPKKSIGKTGYVAGRNYGVRITNEGKGKYRLDHLVDGGVDPGSITLKADELPNGGFGFEYHADRSFVVDNVQVETFPAPPAPLALRLAEFEKQVTSRTQELDAAQSMLDSLKDNPPGKIAWASDLAANPPDTHLLTRGNYATPGSMMSPAPPSALVDPSASFLARPPASGRSTGRRLAFARWLTHPSGRAAALMARVQVNRIWQSYFGTGIVATPENLGLSGAEPTHPELLNWLACEFVESGWSLKHVHLLILNSATFRQSSDQASNGEQLLGFPPQRLEAESIRDAMLSVSGEIESALGGPSIPFQASENGGVEIAEAQAGAHRRTVYLRSRRTQVVSLLQVFDAPSIVYNALRRPRTAMPLQSLTLLNSNFVRARASAFAGRVERSAQTDEGRIERSFEFAFARLPSAEEKKAAAAFLDLQAKTYGNVPDARRKAWVDFCQSLLISNEFLYLD